MPKQYEREYKQIKLREYRLKAGLRQEDLEELSGVPQGTISRVELGKINPSLNVLVRLIRAFNRAGIECTLNDLVDYDCMPVPVSQAVLA